MSSLLSKSKEPTKRPIPVVAEIEVIAHPETESSVETETESLEETETETTGKLSNVVELSFPSLN